MESMGVMFAVLLAVALCVMPARPYHIAFVGIDGAGDFTPLYNMASEAVHRGHKVTVFNDATAVKRFSWEGMQFVPTGASGEGSEFERKKWDWFVQLSQQTKNEEREKLAQAFDMVFAEYYEVQFAALRDHFQKMADRGDLPDVVVSLVFLIAPLDVADLFHVRKVAVMPQMNPFRDDIFSTPSGSCAEFPLEWSYLERWQFLCCRLLEMTDTLPAMLRLQALRSELGIETTFEEVLGLTRSVVSSVRGLARPAPVSALTEYVGAMVDERNLEGSSFNLAAMSQYDVERLAQARAKHGLPDGEEGELAEYMLTVPSGAELAQWMDRAANGVLVFAFGSTGFPKAEFVCSFLGAFSDAVLRGESERFNAERRPRVLISTPYLVSRDLARCSEVLGNGGDGGREHNSSDSNIVMDPFGGLEEVLTVPWMPQRAVLSHSAVVAFGSHCGYGSLSEALYFGKPVFAYPFHYDQHANALRVEQIGAGVRVSPYDWNNDTVWAAADSFLKNLDSHEAVAQRVSREMHAAGGVARAVQVVEDEVEFGSRHLQYNAKSMTDIVLTIIGTLMALSFCLGVCLTRCCCRGARRPGDKVKAE